MSVKRWNDGMGLKVHVCLSGQKIQTFIKSHKYFLLLCCLIRIKQRCQTCVPYGITNTRRKNNKQSLYRMNFPET